jgi:peptide-methionine (R)-S-oxide reductase
MTIVRYFIALVLLVVTQISCAQQDGKNKAVGVKTDDNRDEKIVKTEEEWKQLLEPEEFEILRNKGTEYAFTGEYNFHKEKGIYQCAGCGNELFASKTKYDSGSGWPSFYAPVNDHAVEQKPDNRFGMTGLEILCSKCGGHLGHVFDDGPKPTGLRYCINSAALDFKKK